MLQVHSMCWKDLLLQNFEVYVIFPKITYHEWNPKPLDEEFLNNVL